MQSNINEQMSTFIFNIDFSEFNGIFIIIFWILAVFTFHNKASYYSRYSILPK